jgi:hypothetical protein
MSGVTVRATFYLSVWFVYLIANRNRHVENRLFFLEYITQVEMCGSKNFISVPVSVFLEQKSLGSVSVIFKKEEQYKCMNSFMYVSSIFTK